MDITAVRALINEVAKKHNLRGQFAEDFKENALEMHKKPSSAAGILSYFEGKPRFAPLKEALTDFHVQLTNLKQFGGQPEESTGLQALA